MAKVNLNAQMLFMYFIRKYWYYKGLICELKRLEIVLGSGIYFWCSSSAISKSKLTYR